ncbi:hypothetical protein BH10PLA2_BH10PLA2_22150 [soil metagenome]
MKAQLVVVYGKPRNTIKSLPPGDCLIGRGDECQVRTNSTLVSRQHCLVQITTHKAFVRDLGSTNGTLVNGKRITRQHELNSGDLVQIGPVVFEFRDASKMNLEPAPAIRVDGAAKPTTSELPRVELCEPVPVHAGSFQADDTHRQSVPNSNANGTVIEAPPCLT